MSGGGRRSECRRPAAFQDSTQDTGEVLLEAETSDDRARHSQPPLTAVDCHL